MTRYVMVEGTITQILPDGRITKQLPTFYLDRNVQGILTYESAHAVATRVINPLDNPRMIVDLTISEVYEHD